MSSHQGRNLLPQRRPQHAPTPTPQIYLHGNEPLLPTVKCAHLGRRYSGATTHKAQQRRHEACKHCPPPDHN